MKIRFNPKRAKRAHRAPGAASNKAFGKRFSAAFDVLFPLCFVPEADADGAGLSVDLPSAAEQAKH